LKDYSSIRREILQGYKIILPVAAVCGLTLYLLRDFIIRFLFTADFLEMEVMFAWQMVGDTLKIGSWILAYLMLGKAMVKLFIFSELLFSGLFYFLVVFLVGLMDLEGVAVAYAVNYFLYW